MKPTLTLTIALLLAPLAALHATEPIINSLGMKFVPIQPGTFTRNLRGQDSLICGSVDEVVRRRRSCLDVNELFLWEKCFMCSIARWHG